MGTRKGSVGEGKSQRRSSETSQRIRKTSKRIEDEIWRGEVSMDTIAGTLKQLTTYEPMALIQFWLKRLGPVLKGCIEVLQEDKVKRSTSWAPEGDWLKAEAWVPSPGICCWLLDLPAARDSLPGGLVNNEPEGSTGEGPWVQHQGVCAPSQRDYDYKSVNCIWCSTQLSLCLGVRLKDPLWYGT